MTTIYKPSPKGLRSHRAKMSEDDRFIFLNAGSAIWFKTTGKIVQVDVLYRNPDSHLVATEEKVSDYTFTIHPGERKHAERYKMKLPPIA